MRTDHELLAALYSRFRKQLYPDYMRGSKLFVSLASGTIPKKYLRWYPLPDNIEHMGSDMCSNCGCSFGYTIGGRLRNSCYHCRSYYSPIDQYQLQQLSLLWNCSVEYTEFLLANALANQVAYFSEHSNAS